MEFLETIGWLCRLVVRFFIRTFIWAGLIGLGIIAISWGMGTFVVPQRPSVYISISSIAFLMGLGETVSYMASVWTPVETARALPKLRARLPQNRTTVVIERRLRQLAELTPSLGDAQNSVLVQARKEVTDWGASDTEWAGIVETDWGKR